MDKSELFTQRKKVISDCIGILAIEFSALEFYIDTSITYFHKFFGGDDIARRIPRTFSQKIMFVQNCIKQVDTMAWAAPYHPALKELERIEKLRNWFIHGHLIRADDNQHIEFVRHSFESYPPDLEHKIFNYLEIHELSVQIRCAWVGMQGLLQIVMDYIDKHVLLKDLEVKK